MEKYSHDIQRILVPMIAFKITLSTLKRHSEVTSRHVLHSLPDMTSNFNHASELY
jgi:hypothetical protein